MLLCSVAFAQPPSAEALAEKQKKKKELDELVVRMLEQATAEAAGLRLSQNRAVVYGMAGDLYWKTDEKRGRELFRSAASALVAHNFEVEKERHESTGNDIYQTRELFDTNDVRADVLPLIAARDAELALELMVQTRPGWLAEAMGRAAQPGLKAEGDIVTYSPESQRVSQEIALEQRFASLAADNDIEKAIKMIKDSLARGVSYHVMPMLQKIHRKDVKKAAELGGEVIKKLIDSDLAASQNDMRVGLNFLQYAVRPAAPSDAKEKPFTFSPADIKDLALEMAGILSQPAKSMAMATMLTQALPTMEKLVPERVVVLKQRAAQNRKSLPDEFRAMEKRQRLWNGNSTPEEILAEIAKTPNKSDRMQAYRLLTSQIGQIPDEARAKRLIDQIPDERFRAAALEQLESRQIAAMSGAGRIDEARRMIGTVSNRTIRVQKLVAVALQLHKRGGKDVEAAGSVMAEAKSLTKEFPEDEDDLACLMEIVKGYVTIEPDTAFRLFEPAIEQFNETVQAGAVLSKYNKRDRMFKKGELAMKTYGFPSSGVLLFRFIPQMQMLGKADLEKMSGLADRFARSDSRTIVRLYVLQGYLK